ncbi:MAG: hypothetical protein HY676_02065 [Chloroflexi bacterium]|nr:hypothetical protein [Chloroflexota bacterium]
MALSPKDLYRLRRAQLQLESRRLQAQLAQHTLREMMLELERKYDLLCKEVTLDINTGMITSNGPPGGSGPSAEEAHEP